MVSPGRYKSGKHGKHARNHEYHIVLLRQSCAHLTMTTPAVPLPLAQVMLVEEDKGDNPIEKLKQLDILPTLYNLLHDLDTGQIKAKDFDNNAGSLRLKLGLFRQYLSQIEGIGDTVKLREAKIEQLRAKNRDKWQLLERIREEIEQGQPGIVKDTDVIME